MMQQEVCNVDVSLWDGGKSTGWGLKAREPSSTSATYLAGDLVISLSMPLDDLGRLEPIVSSTLSSPEKL